MTPKSRDRDRDNEAQLDELGDDPGQVGSDSAGQSGDSQGLSDIAESAAESVEELADTDQAYPSFRVIPSVTATVNITHDGEW